MGTLNARRGIKEAIHNLDASKAQEQSHVLLSFLIHSLTFR